MRMKNTNHNVYYKNIYKEYNTIKRILYIIVDKLEKNIMVRLSVWLSLIQILLLFSMATDFE